MRRDLLVFLAVAWPLYLNDFWVAALVKQSLVLFWCVDALTYTLMPCVTVYYFLKKGDLKADEIGLRSPLKISNLLLGFLLFCFLIFSVEMILQHWFRVWFHSVALTEGYTLPDPGYIRFIIVGYAGLSAGFVEEILFRGVLIALLFRHSNSTFFVAVFSIFLFGLIHWGQGLDRVLVAMVWSIIPTVWYLKSRNLWGLILCHCLYDWISFSGVLQQLLAQAR